jgi:hypothetical protein
MAKKNLPLTSSKDTKKNSNINQPTKTTIHKCQTIKVTQNAFTLYNVSINLSIFLSLDIELVVKRFICI